MSLSTRELAEYLDGYLRVHEIEDSRNALNGLQVENDGTLSCLAIAVDACQVTIDRAVELGAGVLLVHHGLFWGGLEPLVGRHGNRVRALMRHNLALYSAHLPLDLHPEVGNNAVLARQLQLADPESFGDYLGHRLGVAGTLQTTRAGLVDRVRLAFGVEPHVIAAGPDQVRRVGIVSGGGGAMIGDAVRAGVDTYLTGEGTHHTHFDAEEWGINVIYAGHYATETVGVRALAAHLEERFGLPWHFIDHPTGL
jgi:dinuclear metal center YbgI/SA1388 family protein